MELRPKRYIGFRNDNCIECGFCRQLLNCSLKAYGCIGCGACVIGCPQAARELRDKSSNCPLDVSEDRELLDFFVDGEPQQLRGSISVLMALDQLGIGQRTSHHKIKDPNCHTGGCWNCALLIDGILTPSCVTPLRSGMKITTNPEIINKTTPRRVVSLMRPAPHRHPSIFTHGCNFRCDLCHNWDLTFSSTANALTPKQTVEQLALRPDKDNWIGISGGEPTLYRKWLLETIRELRQKIPDSHIQLDTNASLLTVDYIDELVDAGITDISPDLKAIRLETFMKVSGIFDKEVAKQYMYNVWEAIKYLYQNYNDRVFMAVAIPCHPQIHSKGEMEEMAAAVASLSPEIHITLTQIQPAFRIRDLPQLSQHTMTKAESLFRINGLRHIIIQGGSGIPIATHPSNLMVCTE